MEWGRTLRALYTGFLALPICQYIADLSQKYRENLRQRRAAELPAQRVDHERPMDMRAELESALYVSERQTGDVPAQPPADIYDISSCVGNDA